MQTKIKGLNQSGAEQDVRVTDDGIVVTMTASQLWTAKGYGTQAMATAAIAGLVVRPTTTAAATLFNNESGAGKHLVLDRVMVHQLVSGAAETRFGLWLCSHPTGMAAPTNDITVRNHTSGGAAGGSNSIFDNGATVVDDGWFPWDDSVSGEPTGVLPGGQISAAIGGKIIVPPQGGLSAHIVASSVNEDFTIGFHWYEVPEGELAVA